LGIEHSRQVARAVLAGLLVNQITEDLVAKADGNPLFLEQLVLHAGEATTGRAELTVPATVNDVIMARIDRLPAVSKQLLQTAAVIGREFSLHLLNAVWGRPEPIDALLGELCRLEFLDEKSEPEGVTYTFHHALTREAAFGSLLERQRRATHARIGAAFEALYEGRTDEIVELLALHFGRSDEAEKAVDYAIAAAEKAGRGWANTEALNYFSAALTRLDAMPDTAANRLRRIDAVLKQVDIKYLLGEYPSAIEALNKIANLVDATGDPRRQSTWHYWIGLLHSVAGGRADVAIERCYDAAQIASAAGLDELEALAEACLAQVYVVVGRLREAIEAGEHALSRFETRGNRWWAARTLWFLSIAANALGRWDASLNYCRRALEHGDVLKELRVKSVQAIGWARMGSAYVQQGDLKRGRECCEEALAHAAIQRDVMIAKAARAYAEIKAGRFDRGIADLAEAAEWHDRSDLRYSYLRYALWLAEGHLRRGDRTPARPLIAHVLSTSRSLGYRHCEGLACWLMGECLATDAAAEAEGHVATAMQILEGVGAEDDLAKATVTRAALRQRAGDFRAARQLLHRALRCFRALGTMGEPARVEAAIAALDHGLRISLLAEVA
jgi:tetratricopeptide (TPR) repeat protein